MTERVYDRIVVGLGGIGSAALCQLARRGLRVLGIEQFDVAHHRGSSHGQSRIIRKAYFEHPDYVPLLQLAYPQWEQLESECGERLFDRIGLVEFGPKDGTLIRGIEASVQQHALDVERLSAAEIRSRFRMFHVDDATVAIIEPDAGLLHVERCVAAHIQQAQALGAEVVENSPIREIRYLPDRIEVITEGQTFRAAALVACLGAWTNPILQTRLPLTVVRKHLHWFADDGRLSVETGLPAYFFELPDGYYYGFPSLDERGVKVAEHSGRDVVSSPDQLSRSIDDQELQRVRSFLQRVFLEPPDRHTDHTVCMYTLTPDEHFVVDFLPADDRVVFAAGLSGHGFKFAPILGSALADLSTTGTSQLPIQFLRIGDRFDSA